VGNSQDWTNFIDLSDYDIWRLPQADDDWDPCSSGSTFICHRPVFIAGPAGSPISPNLAGRLAADFAVCYQLNRTSKPDLANQCLKSAEDIFALANNGFAEPASSVDGGTCTSGCLLTIIPFDGYPETVWSDDMEARRYGALPGAPVRRKAFESAVWIASD
jgi:endoglucanase